MAVKNDIGSFNLARGFNSTTDGNLESNLSSYNHFLGGVNVTNKSLERIDLARGGYGRLFIMKMPKYMAQILPSATKKVRHYLQFANVGIDGIQGYTVDFSSITAGYAGNTIEIPTNAKDDTSSITIKLYETSTHLIRSYIDTWITGVIDPYTGLTHYHGAMEVKGTTTPCVSQAYHTMEALYVATDPTGTDVKYACLLANMFPKSSDHGMFSFDPGSHDLMQISLDFTANKYMSPQITELGKNLINSYAILKNYLNFKSDYAADSVWQNRDSSKSWYKDAPTGEYTKSMFGGDSKYLKAGYHTDNLTPEN